MGDPPPPHDEADFQRYLDRLDEVAVQGEKLLSGGEETFETDGPCDYPAKAVWDMRTACITHYMAAVDLIRDPLESPAAALMIRAMLEVYAHLVWIWGGELAANRKDPSGKCLGTDADAGCTQKRRAVCFDLGVAVQRSENLKKVDAGVVPDGTAQAVADELAQLQQLHANLGCAGHGRGYGDVKWMLGMLKANGHLPWAHDLWVVSSGVVHGLVPEFYLSSATGIRVKGGPADPETRYKLSGWLASIYANVTDGMLAIQDPGKRPQFKDVVDWATLATGG